MPSGTTAPGHEVLSRLSTECSTGDLSAERLLPVLAEVVSADGFVLFDVASRGGKVKVLGSLGLVGPGLLDGAQSDESAVVAEARRALGRAYVNLNLADRTDPFLEAEGVRHLLLASRESARTTWTVLAFRRGGKPFSPAQAKRFSSAAAMVNLALACRGLEIEIRHLKDHDSLTGLPSYHLFHDSLIREVARARRASRPLTVGLLTLTGEIRGRIDPVLNQVLLEIASLLRAEFREFDILARYGTLEFGFILPELAGIDAVPVVERVLGSVRGKSGSSGFWLPVVGLGCYPQDATTSERLLEIAEGAMAEAVEDGRSGVFRWVRQEPPDGR